ncbi:MAG: Mur ligase family protein [Nitrospirae bacterium]|nr:Mur ligase family protein [Nitrospirota bacterium]
MKFTSLSVATDYLASLTRHGIHPELSSISKVLSGLGSPQDKFPAIQITGTNGKGSTSVILDAIYRRAGFRTGLFTSPHLLDVRERIRIDGNLVGTDVFLESLESVFRTQEKEGVTLTFFETLTAVSFFVFSRSRIDLAILEVGMGGRWDATSLCVPEVSVLTSLAKDHTEILGDTLDLILQEKAAIGRPGKPFVASLPAESLPEWDRQKSLIGFRPVLRGRDFDGRWNGEAEGGMREFSFSGSAFSGNYRTSLVAEYQIHNLSSALAAVGIGPWPVSGKDIREVLPNLSHPGRWEPIPGMSAFLDGAHNPEAVGHLVRQIRNVRKNVRKVAFLAGFIREKDWRSMVEMLSQAGNSFFLVVPPGTDGVDPSTVASHLTENRPGTECIHGPFKSVCRSAFDWLSGDSDRLLVVTGSLYLVAGVQKWLAGDDSPLPAGERTSVPAPS